jgi:putative sporulation protein YyaC
MRKPSTGKHLTRVKYTQPDAAVIISQALLSVYGKPVISPEDILVLCIGTDRSTGDSLGPLVGSKLQEQNPPFQVLGTLDQPVHAANLAETLEHINDSPAAWIIAIDASLGNMDGVGMVNLGFGPLQPGAGVNKRLPPVGDVYITGIVNVGGFMEYFVLQNTRLSLVVKMADIICSGLLQAFATKKTLAGHL